LPAVPETVPAPLPVVETPAEVLMPVPEPVAPVIAAAPAPVIAEAVVEPVAELFEQAPVAVDVQKTAEIEIVVPPVAVEAAVPLDLDKTLADSGLVMVQTTAGRGCAGRPPAGPRPAAQAGGCRGQQRSAIGNGRNAEITDHANQKGTRGCPFSILR